MSKIVELELSALVLVAKIVSMQGVGNVALRSYSTVPPQKKCPYSTGPLVRTAQSHCCEHREVLHKKLWLLVPQTVLTERAR